ncbi:MAG: 50S ribosomal protein L37ae [Thermoplasmatales archaeon]|nr:MAG: 50S ribosomal protein L37ae [Thermoplasmatales archaeon]
MAKRTKKVGTAGRFQARYGVRSRTSVKNVEAQQKAKHICPSCGHQKVKRIGTSIWQCRKCSTKFAGGAYVPYTESGQNVEKILRGEIKVLEMDKEIKGDKKT